MITDRTRSRILAMKPAATKKRKTNQIPQIVKLLQQNSFDFKIYLQKSLQNNLKLGNYTSFGK